MKEARHKEWHTGLLSQKTRTLLRASHLKVIVHARLWPSHAPCALHYSRGLGWVGEGTVIVGMFPEVARGLLCSWLTSKGRVDWRCWNKAGEQREGGRGHEWGFTGCSKPYSHVQRLRLSHFAL